MISTVNLFGASTKNDIKVGYISTTRGYVTGVGIRDANKYAKSDPGTKFILQNRDYIKYLSINEVNELTPEVLETIPRKMDPATGRPRESCKGVEWEAPIEDPEVIFSGGGGVGVVGNPVFGTDGTLLAVDLVSGGFGYKYAPVTKLRDVSGKGAGAHLISIVGEIADTEILYDKKEDFEDYIIDDDTEEEVKQIWYGPDGKEIGTWDPSLYLGEVGRSFDTITDNYIERLQEIATSGVVGQGGAEQDSAGVFWWAAKPPGPKAVTSNGKTTRNIYKVEHVAWNQTPPPLDSEGNVLDWSTNGWLNTHAISPIPPSHAKGSARGGELFTLEWDVDFPWDGEYSFRGSADNSAIVYVDNQELTRYELGSGGAAGKVLSLPTIVKKELKGGSHNIRIDLRNHEHIVKKKVQASSKTYGSLLLVEDIPQVAAEDQGGVTYDDLTCYARMGRFFDINGNKAKYKVDPSLNEPEGSDLEVDFRVTTSTAFINKIEVKDLFTEQGPELIKGEPTLPEISQIEASAKFSSRGSGKDTKYYMTVTGNDLLDIQLEFRKHRDDSTRGGGHSVNAITIQTEEEPLELLTGPVSPDAAWPFDDAMITVKTGRFKNAKEYEITFSEARFQAPKPTPRIQFFGLNPANNPIEVRNNNKTLCLKDSSGSDCNAQFNIDSGDFIFAPDGRSVVGNRGMITMTLSWNDNPDVAGKAVNQIQFAGQKWFQTNCIPTTGVTPAGYANTTRGYVKFNDGFRVTGSYVTSYISTWLTQTIRTGFTYQEVFDQIVSSYATILSRKPEAEGFDYWVNSFRDNTSWTLSSLNAAISQDANNPTTGELLLHTEHNGVEGNYDECDENFFASNYGQSRTSGSQTRTFYYTTENAPPPQVSNNDQRLAFFDEDVSEGASVSDPDLIGDVRAHFNILNIEQISSSVPALPGQMELKQLEKNFKKTVVVGKVYPVTVTNAGQGLMGNFPAPLPAIQVRDIVNQDVQNTDGSETSIEKTKVFNTVDYITSANRKLWRTNVNMRGGFMNDYGVCPFDTYDTLPDNPYAGTHTLRWNNINFPISGNYTIRIGVDDNVDLKIGTKKGGNVLTISKEGYIFPADGGIKSTGVGTYVRYIEAGRYTIQADLTQIPGGKFGFGKIKKEGAIHDYSGHGLNPMALAITIDTTVSDVEEVVQRSWHANPMGVALNIKAPLPPAPVQPIPKQEGRCPSNPVWSTRFPNAKDGTWYPVRFDSWTKFHNSYGMSPVPPLPIGGTDNGGVPFSNRWDVQIPYNGWYKLKATIDDIGTISIDGDVKLELSNANKVETKEELFYLSEGLKEVEVVIENNSTKISNWIDQKVFNTKDWVNIDPPRGGGIEKDVSFRVSTNTALQNSIKIKGLLFEQGPKWGSTTSTRTDLITNLIPGPTTPAAVEFIKRDSKYYLKASGNNKVQVKFDFRCVAPIFKGGAVLPACVPSTGITPAGYGNTIKGYLMYNDGVVSNNDFVTSYISTWLTDIIKGGQPICEPSTGITPAGYGNTTKGYLKFNDNFIINYDFVTSYISTWSTDIIKTGYTYQQVFEQITTSYATILSRKPEAEGFDYWVNSFKDNVDWTLSDLNDNISLSANESPDGTLSSTDGKQNPWIKSHPSTNWSGSSTAFLRDYAVFPVHDGTQNGIDHTGIWYIDVKTAGNYTLEVQSDDTAKIDWDNNRVASTRWTDGGVRSFTIPNVPTGTHKLAAIVRNNAAFGVPWYDNPGGVAWTLKDPSGTVVATSLVPFNDNISLSANESSDGELLVYAAHNGLEGNYDECNDNFFASNYGQPTLSQVYTYQQVFEQITESYATILSRRPEAIAFDYWVNSFKDNTGWSLADLNTAISDSANESPGGEFLVNASHNGLEGNYDECNENFLAFDYGQEPITNIPEPAAIESVIIQTMDAPLRFDNLVGESTTLPDWPFNGSSVVKDAVFENGKEYEVTFSGLLSSVQSTPAIEYIGLKTAGDKKYINSKKLVFDDDSSNGFDVNATFTIDSGDVTFSSDGNSLVGSKSGNVTMTYSWNDHPNIAGVVLDEIKIGDTTWKQSGVNGKVTRTFNFIADPNPTSQPEISSGGATDNSDTNQPNQRICFYDTDTSAGATPGPDLDGDVRAHFTAINVIQMDDPDTIEEIEEQVVEFDDKELVQINNTVLKDVVIGQVYEVEIDNAGTGYFPGDYVAPPNHLKAAGGVLMVEDIPEIAAEDQGGITHDDLVCSASKGRFFDINGNKCKYMIDPPTSGGALRNGVTYNGPKLWNYKHNAYGEFLNNDGVSPDYPVNDIGQTINYVWSNVDFPETGEYTFKFANDAHGSLYLDGQTVIDGDFDTIAGISNQDRSNWDPGLSKKMKVNKGKHTIAVAPKGSLGLTDVNADGLFRKLSDDYYRGQQAWENNASAMAVSITRKVDAFAGTPEASKSWMENPISISAELIPPPCPRRVRGGGVITEVEIIDPGNEYTPPPPPGDGYPVIVELDDIVVDDPGINYDCSKDKVVIEPANGAEASLECDNFGRIKKVNLDNPGNGFTTWPDITIDSPTGVAAALRPKFKITRELPPAVMIDEGLDPDKLIQVTDLVGLNQTGYYDGKPYYGAVFYKDGVRYAGYYETTGVLVQIYDTMQESIDGMVTTPASAILRQGTDIASDDPNLDIPNTPDTLT